MSRLRSLARGAFDFLVGEDWLVALGVAVTLGAVALLASAGLSAWWLTPPCVLCLLAASLARAGRASGSS